MALLKRISASVPIAWNTLRSRRSRLVQAAVAAVGAVAGGLALRRRRGRGVQLPAPGPLAAEAAVSVHNAAKGAVISAVREAERPDEALVADVVARAVTDAATTGVDVTAAAIGAVEGAIEIAHLVDVAPAEIAGTTAAVAIDAAEREGTTAGDRVRDVLGPAVTPP